MKTTEKVNNKMTGNEEVLEAKKELENGLSDEDLKDVAGGQVYTKYGKVNTIQWG